MRSLRLSLLESARVAFSNLMISREDIFGAVDSLTSLEKKLAQGCAEGRSRSLCIKLVTWGLIFHKGASLPAPRGTGMLFAPLLSSTRAPEALGEVAERCLAALHSGLCTCVTHRWNEQATPAPFSPALVHIRRSAKLPWAELKSYSINLTQL